MHCDLICWETDPCLKASYVNTEITRHNKWSEVQADKQKTTTKNAPLISKTARSLFVFIKKGKKSNLGKNKTKTHTDITKQREANNNNNHQPPQKIKNTFPQSQKLPKLPKLPQLPKLLSELQLPRIPHPIRPPPIRDMP